MTDIPIDIPRDRKKACKGCSKKKYEKNLRGDWCLECWASLIKSLNTLEEGKKNDVSCWIGDVYKLLEASNKVEMSELSLKEVDNMMWLLSEINQIETGLGKVSKE